MERTVPSTASEEIDLYQRTYYSLLRSTAEVQIRTLEEAHARMKSLLHAGAREPAPDLSAFIYCLLRLPLCMAVVELIVLGQSTSVFERRRTGETPVPHPLTGGTPVPHRVPDLRSSLACFIAS